MTHIYVAMNVVRANLLKKVVTFLSGLRQGRNPENWNGFQHLSARRTNLNMNKYPTPHHPTPQQQFKECIKARGCSAEELELPNFVPYGRLVCSFHSDSSLLHWRSLQTQACISVINLGILKLSCQWWHVHTCCRCHQVCRRKRGGKRRRWSSFRCPARPVRLLGWSPEIKLCSML